MNYDISYLADLAKEAGEAVLEIYGSEFTVEQKADRSPLTQADTRSHEIISAGLASRFPDIPILSEEGKAISYDDRRNWSRFWLVDPLDGTKEFIKRNGEFTINIALIDKHAPVLGVIYIPVTKQLFVGEAGQGCWEESEGRRRPLRIAPVPSGEPLRVVCSRSHISTELEELLGELGDHQRVSRGSSLKFCAIAAGDADFYPRMGPTWEWDTGAGQAVVGAAGGIVVDLNGAPFAYNKRNLVNGSFLVAPSLKWLEQVGILEKAASISECMGKERG